MGSKQERGQRGQVGSLSRGVHLPTTAPAPPAKSLPLLLGPPFNSLTPAVSLDCVCLTAPGTCLCDPSKSDPHSAHGCPSPHPFCWEEGDVPRWKLLKLHPPSRPGPCLVAISFQLVDLFQDPPVTRHCADIIGDTGTPRQLSSFGSEWTQVTLLALPLFNCVTLGELLNLSDPQFSWSVNQE